MKNDGKKVLLYISGKIPVKGKDRKVRFLEYDMSGRKIRFLYRRLKTTTKIEWLDPKSIKNSSYLKRKQNILQGFLNISQEYLRTSEWNLNNWIEVRKM